MNIQNFQIPRNPSLAEQLPFETAGQMLTRFSLEIKMWTHHYRETTKDKDSQLELTMSLPNGHTISILRAAAVSKTGIQVQGLLNGTPSMCLVDKSAFNITCFFSKVEPEAPRRTIGFHVDNEEVQVS